MIRTQPCNLGCITRQIVYDGDGQRYLDLEWVAPNVPSFKVSYPVGTKSPAQIEAACLSLFLDELASYVYHQAHPRKNQ